MPVPVQAPGRYPLWCHGNLRVTGNVGTPAPGMDTQLAELLPLARGSRGDEPGIIPREELVGHGETGQLRMEEHHLLSMGMEGL